MNLHEIEEAIRDLEQGSCTYNNCMKLASLYIIRDQLMKKPTEYTRYTHIPMTYNRQPMYYTDNNDLMIKKDMGMMR